MLFNHTNAASIMFFLLSGLESMLFSNQLLHLKTFEPLISFRQSSAVMRLFVFSLDVSQQQQQHSISSINLLSDLSQPDRELKESSQNPSAAVDDGETVDLEWKLLLLTFAGTGGFTLVSSANYRKSPAAESTSTYRATNWLLLLLLRVNTVHFLYS